MLIKNINFPLNIVIFIVFFTVLIDFTFIDEFLEKQILLFFKNNIADFFVDLRKSPDLILLFLIIEYLSP